MLSGRIGKVMLQGCKIESRLWLSCTDLYTMHEALRESGGTAKAFYSSRPGSAWDFTHVRLIFMNDSFIKCVSSILKYWRNILITEENELINQPHSVVHPGLCCRWPWYCPWGCDQSIGSTVSDAIDSSWLWSTATRSSPLDYFSRLLQVVDNWPHILW